MDDHLTIHNFGPIRDAEITIRDLTILVGPQATGKSLAAQLLYFLRNLPDQIPPATPDSPAATLSALASWLGNPLAVYAGPGARLTWTHGSSHADIHWEQAQQSPRVRYEPPQEEARRSGAEDVYIPAGRALYSFLPPYVVVSRLRASEEWPGYVRVFYETLGRAVRRLWQQGGTPQPSWRISPFVQDRIDSIIKGRLVYGPDSIQLETAKRRLRSTTIAAGQMELWPFWAIVQANTQAGSRTRFYLEEPEAHLHPGAQRSVMEVIAYLVNRQNAQFLLTTHSPYILYAVNNFLMAHKVLAAGKTLPDDAPPEVALRADQVAAYRFAPDGTVHDIMDAEVGLIDEDELDRVADELGATFARLQERLEGVA